MDLTQISAFVALLVSDLRPFLVLLSKPIGLSAHLSDGRLCLDNGDRKEYS